MVEHQLPKLRVASSSLVSRFEKSLLLGESRSGAGGYPLEGVRRKAQDRSMRRIAAVGALVVLLSLAGCGGASKLPRGGSLAWQTGILNLQWCAQHGFSGTYSLTGYTCRGSAAWDTNALLISTLNQWHLDGRLRASLLNQAANKLQAYCAGCVAIIERERAQLPASSSGVSPIVWIYALWCLVGGILGAVIARSKNRKTWHGALLGVLLGLIGVLIVALLPARPEAASVGDAGGDAVEAEVPPAPESSTEDEAEALEPAREEPAPPASAPDLDIDDSIDSGRSDRETQRSATERDREARHKELTLGYIDELLAEAENEQDSELE